jgi:hypothetical protein
MKKGNGYNHINQNLRNKIIIKSFHSRGALSFHAVQTLFSIKKCNNHFTANRPSLVAICALPDISAL